MMPSTQCQITRNALIRNKLISFSLFNKIVFKKFYTRFGDCEDFGYINPNGTVVTNTLTLFQNQCRGKSSCEITAIKAILPRCQNKTASYLFVVYGPSTCKVINNGIF